MIFLRRVRTLRLVDLDTQRVLFEHRLVASLPKAIDLALDDRVGAGEEVVLRTSDDIARSWTRYSLSVPVSASPRPEHKAVGPTTPLAIAVPVHGGKGGSRGLPTQVRGDLPFHFNAQFEPTTNREGLLWTPGGIAG